MLESFLALLLSVSAWSVGHPRLAAEDLRLPALQGSPPILERSGLKLLLLDFWASWCEPCKDSLPLYQKQKADWEKRGIFIHTVSADEEIQDARKYLREQKVRLPAAWDEGRALAKKLKIDSIPVLVAVTRDGRIVGLKKGFNAKTPKELPALIETWRKAADRTK